MELKKTLLVALTRNNGSKVDFIDKDDRLIGHMRFEDTSSYILHKMWNEEVEYEMVPYYEDMKIKFKNLTKEDFFDKLD